MSHRFSSKSSMDREWDPMQEAHRDPHFNSYRDGPGANLDLDKQPCSTGSSKEKTYKLHVSSVPSDIDKEGVENIFRTVGNPIEVMRARPPANWAFVTFRTLGEAEKARRELDRCPPLRLRIQYAKALEDGVRKRPIDNFEFPPASENCVVTRKSVENTKPRYRGPVWEMAFGKGRGLAVAPFVDPRTPRPGSSQEKTDIRQFQEYGGSNYDESNTAIMKGVQRANGPSGPRKFVMGRGCFDREMDKICQPKALGEILPNVEEGKNSIEKFFQRRNGTYEYSKKEYPPDWVQGTCTYCKNPSTHYCAQCKDWYCSKSCQERDWPRHRAYCGRSSITNQRDSPDQRNSNPISPPRKGKGKGGREFASHQQNNGYSPPSKEALSTESRFSKRKDKKYNGVDSNDRSPESLCSSQFPRNETKKSPWNNNVTSLHGNENKFSKKVYETSSQNGSDESECSFGNETKTASNNISLPTKNKEFPKKSLNVSDRSEETYDKESKSFAKGKNGENLAREKFHNKKSLMNNNSRTDRNYSSEPKHASPSKRNSEKTSKSTNSVQEQPKGKCLMIIEETEQLSENSFTKVAVQIPLGDDEYWVVLASNFEEIIKMSSTMGMQTDLAPVELSTGTYCMAKYENIWYRARITSLEPRLTVFFIDFGNEEKVIPEELKELPDSLKNMKSQAIRIKLAPGTSQKYQMLDIAKDIAELSVKSVYQNKDNLVTVHVEGEVYNHMPMVDEPVHGVEVVQEETPIALQSVTVLLTSDTKCSLITTEYNNDEEFLACLVPAGLTDIYNSLFSPAFYEECEHQSDNFMPKIGEAVVAKFSEEGWIRGYVLHVSSKKEFTVASCDLGIVEIVKDVRKMPQKYREIAQFAVQCGVLEDCISIDMSKFSGTITIESCTSDKAVAITEKSGMKCKIEIKKWEIPYELYEELRCVELKNGICIIAAEMSPFELYIRPRTDSCTDIYNRLLQDVAKHCYKSPSLKYVPKVGQILAAQYTQDGNFYRAIVREVHTSKGVKVQYIDFGNVEYVPQDSLKPLNETLRSIESCVVKVILEDVVDRPLNEAVQNLFKDLILREVPLKVKLSEPQSNKVHLYAKDGTDLNEKINKMLIPGWKKGFVDKEIYTIDDVAIEALDFDTPLELVILTVIGKDNEIVVRPKKSKLVQVLQNDLQDAIDEYCNNSREPYTPREMELCVARVDNTWCRCLCLTGGNPLSLYLLDDGRVRDVAHEHIRKYLRDFTALPAVGIHCKIRTKATPAKKEEISRAIRHYLTTMKVITAEVIQALPEDSKLKGYIITVPELNEALETL